MVKGSGGEGARGRGGRGEGGRGGNTRRLSVKECFTGKYTTPKIHTNLHPGPLEYILRILNIDDVISRYCTAQLANFAKVG